MTRFDEVFKIVLGEEGGYVNDPTDPGGETKYGISKNSYPHLDIANLTLNQAKQIYKINYWDAIQGDDLPEPLDHIAFDTAVNQGVGAARKLLAYSDDPAEFLSRRLLDYTDFSLWPRFGRGWTKRLARLIPFLSKPIVHVFLSDGGKFKEVTGTRFTVKGETTINLIGPNYYIRTEKQND